MKKESLYRHPAIRLLQKAIRRELIVQFLLYSCLILLGVLVAWRFFNASTLFFIAGLFFSSLGIYYTIRLLPYWATKHHPIMVQLKLEPNQIVWVYTVVTQQMPYGLALQEYGLLYLKLLDGEDLCVGMPVRHLRVVSRCLHRLLPHATFGYTPGKEQLYRINPEMLIQ